MSNTIFDPFSVLVVMTVCQMKLSKRLHDAYHCGCGFGLVLDSQATSLWTVTEPSATRNDFHQIAPSLHCRLSWFEVYLVFGWRHDHTWCMASKVTTSHRGHRIQCVIAYSNSFSGACRSTICRDRIGCLPEYLRWQGDWSFSWSSFLGFCERLSRFCDTLQENLPNNDGLIMRSPQSQYDSNYQDVEVSDHTAISRYVSRAFAHHRNLSCGTEVPKLWCLPGRYLPIRHSNGNFSVISKPHVWEIRTSRVVK